MNSPIKEDTFDAMESAYYRAKHTGPIPPTRSEIERIAWVLADMRRYLFTPPTPVLIDVDTLREAVKALEASDGDNIRTQQIICALTRTINGCTHV